MISVNLYLYHTWHVEMIVLSALDFDIKESNDD